MQQVIKIAKIKPAVNQVRMRHSHGSVLGVILMILQLPDPIRRLQLLSTQGTLGILCQAWYCCGSIQQPHVVFFHFGLVYNSLFTLNLNDSPITRYPGGPVDSPVQAAAKRLNATPTQVILAWVRSKGVVPVTYVLFFCFQPHILYTVLTR